MHAFITKCPVHTLIKKSSKKQPDAQIRCSEEVWALDIHMGISRDNIKAWTWMQCPQEKALQNGQEIVSIPNPEETTTCTD